MRRTLTIALAAIALGGLPAAATARSSEAPRATAAHSCSPGWKHAVIGGSHKCLRAGQYCARRYERTYSRYGYTCRATSTGYRLRSR